MTNELIIESFDKNDPYEVALERQIRDINGSNDLWSNDKEFPKNVRRASMLCNDAEIEGLTYALYKYRIMKTEGKTHMDGERNRWEQAMSHSHSKFQRRINFFKKLIGRLMSKLQKRKVEAGIHHHLHELVKGELGKEKFCSLVEQAEALRSFEKEKAEKDPETTCMCGCDIKEHKDIAGFNPPCYACEKCGWEKCDDFLSIHDVQEMMSKRNEERLPIVQCKCGGKYALGDDPWPSRVRCDRCGDWYDL